MQHTTTHEGPPRCCGIRMAAALAFAAVAAIAAGSARAASTPEDFHVATADDFVALCTAQADDPNYVAATHFCHGFAVGAYRYYQAVAEAAPEHRYVCVPEPPPSRTYAISEFVKWTQAHPEQLQQQAIDAIFRFLGETYPCSE